MFFQIPNSPKEPQIQAKPKPVAEESAVLKLAPFAANPKIFFENIHVGEEAAKLLVVQNPNAFNNKLTITKIPPADRHVEFNWIETEVEANNEIILEIKWCPKEEGGWRDVISIVDSRNVKRDIPIVFKSLGKTTKKIKSRNNNKPKATAVAKSVKKFSPKSLKNNKKRSPFKVPIEKLPKMRNNKYYNESDKENSPIIHQNIPVKFCENKDNSQFYQNSFRSAIECMNFSYQNKMSFSEKLNKLDSSPLFRSPTNINFKCDNITTPLRRDTYNINSVVAPKQVDEFNDSLECEKMFDDINFESPNQDYLVRKIMTSNSFTFDDKTPRSFTFLLNDTKILGEITNDAFIPGNCSTEVKNQPVKAAEKNLSNPKELFKSNNTFDLNEDLRNISSETYNLSGGTYTIENTSTTSTIASSFNEIEKATSFNRMRTSSPVTVECINPNYFNFSGVNAKTALSCITEEDLASETFNKLTQNLSSFSSCSNRSKRKSELPETVFHVSPPKRPFLKSPNHKNTTWNKKLEKTERIRKKSISSLRLNLTKNVCVKSTAVTITKELCNIDPFLIAAMYDTSTVSTELDPFIASSLYYDEQWLDKQISELKKWLNALLTPPSELCASAESKKVDVAKIWQDCIKKELVYAPTKEKISLKYHTNHRLEHLRLKAKEMFRSNDVTSVLSKVAVTLENKMLVIREDKNVHLDVGLQAQIMTILLCYNPLWLRIGLETIYNETIPLESNSDVISLSTFIMLRFFHNPELSKNHSVVHTKYLPGYAVRIKKFTLKKFLLLVYFLDYAKRNKLIAHDPCLFCRDAPIKESKEILISFARELLSAVGDVTRFLRRFGYEVSHKQSYIDEFNYAVKNLGVDLRDGIRLTKVMEIILLRNDMTCQLRGPAISRLQKMHNVRVAMDSLKNANYTIAGDITPKDIVDGHREKTLSLLWQIIYKFQAPKFTVAASKLQKWWRSIAVQIKLRILDRPRRQKTNAAIKIQQFYRAHKLMKIQRNDFLKRRNAAITIQKYFRAVSLARKQRTNYLLTRRACITVQRRFRANKAMKIEKLKYTTYVNTVLLVQRKFKAKLEMKKQQKQYLQQRNAAIYIQNKFRAWLLMKEQREQYLQLKLAVVTIQQKYLAKIAMRNAQQHYWNVRCAVIKIQRKFRAYLLMKRVLLNYLITREAVIVVQQQFRANKAMRECRHNYLELRRSAIIIQQQFRAYISMKNNRESYLKLKQSVITIQQRFRAKKELKEYRNNYLELRKSAIIIQQQFRAYISMRNNRESYLTLKQSATTIQQRFRANREMKLLRNEYLLQKHAVNTIQNKWRATDSMRKCRTDFLELRKATIILQQHYRANVAMKMEREKYLNTRKAVCILQERFRANVAMKETRRKYLITKQSVAVIQERFRAFRKMKLIREQYILQRNAAILIQQRFRATILMKTVRNEYLIKVKSARIIQDKYRAYLLMKHVRQTYLLKKEAATTIQQRFRGTILMKTVRNEYLIKKKATRIIQNKFRAYLTMKQVRKDYLCQREAIIIIQQRLRATILMKTGRNEYLAKLRAVRTIQNKFRAYLLMKRVRQTYLHQKKAVVTIQQKLRATLLMKSIRNEYLMKLKVVRTIQERFRSYLLMKEARLNYLLTKEAAIIIQQRFRALVLMRTVRNEYLAKLEAVRLIQNKFRAYLLMKQLRQSYLRKKEAAIKIQQKLRATILMKSIRNEYLIKLKAARIIQDIFRAYLLMKQVRQNYLLTKEAAIIIQQRFRALVLMRTVRNEYTIKLEAIRTIQNQFKASLLMKETRKKYLMQKEAAIIIQQRFKATLLMKTTRAKFLIKKDAAQIIQNKFRAYLLMKKVRNDYLRQKEAIISIQRRFRATLLMKTVQKEYLIKKEAVQTIQNKFRAYLLSREIRENYLQLRKTVIQIQQRFRATLVMKTVRNEYLIKLIAVLTIQNKFRAYLLMKETRQTYLRQKEAAIKIQQKIRATILMRTVRNEYLMKLKVVRTIQDRFRSYLLIKEARLNYLLTKEAAIIIQQRFRALVLMKTVRNEYFAKLEAIRLIQNKFRAYLLMKQVRQSYLRKKEAVIKIQQKLRATILMKSTRNEYLMKLEATIFIQNKFRAHRLMRQQRTIYLQQKQSARLIQQHYRQYKLMQKQQNEFSQIQQATRIVQKYFRNYLIMKEERIQFLNYKLSVIKIQTYYRHYLIMKKERHDFLEKKRAVVKIQSWWRMLLAKKLLAKLIEDSKDTEEKRIERRLNQAAAKIQALWRGYKSRSVEDSTITLIRQRTRDANKNASPEFTMGQRNLEAIQLLIYQTSMKEIIRALRILDFTTRLFPQACVEVVDQIVDQLYLLLANTNRSIPDMEAGGLCISVLINLYKFGPTSKSVWRVDYIDTLLSLLLHWSDKEGVLFVNLCTLIWLFSQKPENCRVILAEENASKRLLKTYQQCERKQKMLSKMKNTNNSINTNINKKFVKQVKSNENGTTTTKLAKVKNGCDPIPSLSPDWGIINKNRPRTFQNPIFAMKCLLKKMNLSN